MTDLQIRPDLKLKVYLVTGNVAVEPHELPPALKMTVNLGAVIYAGLTDAQINAMLDARIEPLEQMLNNPQADFVGTIDAIWSSN